MAITEITKLCPFCGVSPSHFSQSADGLVGAIYCDNCGAKGPIVKIPDHDNSRLPQWQFAAITQWNTRESG